MTTYPDFVDEFPYDDAATITGLVSETGHVWTGSGANLPAIVDNQLASSGSSGNYAFTDIYQNPFYQYADVTPNAGGSGIVLMSSNEGFNLIQYTHFRFTLTTLNLEMRGDIVNQNVGSPGNIPDVAVPDIVYDTPMVAGQTYRIGVYHYGSRFVFDLPDGNQYEFASPIAASVVGRYLCYQQLASKSSKVGCTLNNRTIQAP